MAKRRRFLRLLSLVPFLQSERNGDEVFIRFKGKKVAPKKEKYYQMTGEPHTLNLEIQLGDADKWVELELWEYDPLMPNSKLGQFRLLVDQHSDTFTTDLTREDDSSARYTLNWELVSRLA